MNANGCVNPITLFGKWDGGVEFFRPGARADRQKSRYACDARAFEHGVTVFRKLRKINVGMGIGEVHSYLVAQTLLSVRSAAKRTAQARVPVLLQPRADFDVFVGKASKDRAAIRADRGGDYHAVGLDATQLTGREIHDHRDFAAY